MIYINDDILNTECQVILHGCNMQGKMNSGVARSIREKYPEAYEAYMKYIGLSKLGEFIPCAVKGSSKIIGNLLTQQNYGYDGKRYASLEAIENSVDSFLYFYKGVLKIVGNTEPPDIAIPKIGCGLGGLDWTHEVMPIFEKLSDKHDVYFWVYYT